MGGGWRFPLVRIDTNQGLSGYGEVRDGASKTYALMLKSRLLGENPCNVDKLFRKIKQFGHHARQGGGVCGVEMALMDLAGKAYGVPAYALAGGKFRDAIRMYCDTPNEPTGEAMGHKLQERLERGFTMLKMDVGIGAADRRAEHAQLPGRHAAAQGRHAIERMRDINTIQHPFTHVRLTHKGMHLLVEYVAEVRAVAWATRCPSPPTTSATSASTTACAWARRWSPSTWPGWRTWCPGSSPTSGCSSSAPSTRRCAPAKTST